MGNKILGVETYAGKLQSLEFSKGLLPETLTLSDQLEFMNFCTQYFYFKLKLQTLTLGLMSPWIRVLAHEWVELDSLSTGDWISQSLAIRNR